MKKMKKILVSILVFDGVEELDFIGPLEVFGVASRLTKRAKIEVATLGWRKGHIQGAHGLKFLPRISDHSKRTPDICVVPGGPGARKGIYDPSFIRWVEKVTKGVPHILSVCTGSLVLAKMGLLDGLSATTHWASLGELRKLAPLCHVVKNARFVDTGRTVTSAGVSAGLDASLHLLERLFGKGLSQRTAKRMEYRR